MGTQSVSRRQLILEIQGKVKVRCELKRHLSPRTVGIIMRSLPLEGHAHILGESIAYFETVIDSGTERPKKEFKKGDVAFLPSSGSMCFFLSDTVGKTMTPLGRLDGDVDELKTAVPGDVFRLYEEAA